MPFRDRKEAGQKLAQALEKFKNAADTLIIALPRGGVVVGYEVAKYLHLSLDVVCPRKISAPFNPELAIGAVTETGEGILNYKLITELGVSEGYLKTALEKQTQEAKRRLHDYRNHRNPLILKDKTVIVVDDGLATGSTMLAALKSIRVENPRTLILAIPVAPPDTLERVKKLVEEAICLEAPSTFYAVGQFYEQFDQVNDLEVKQLLSKNILYQVKFSSS